MWLILQPSLWTSHQAEWWSSSLSVTDKVSFGAFVKVRGLIMDWWRHKDTWQSFVSAGSRQTLVRTSLHLTLTKRCSTVQPLYNSEGQTLLWLFKYNNSYIYKWQSYPTMPLTECSRKTDVINRDFSSGLLNNDSKNEKKMFITLAVCYHVN